VGKSVKGGKGGGSGTHVEGFKVFADFSDELFAALVALWKPCVWRVGLREGEEGEGGACEGEEAADVLLAGRVQSCQGHVERREREVTFSTLPRSCIWRAVRDEDQTGSES